MYEVEIRNGLDLLDEKLGRDVWLSRVNAESIVMSDCFSCVGAQAVGAGYIDSMRALGILPDDGSDTLTMDLFERECHYGFEVTRGLADTPRGIIRKYAALTAEWRATIAAIKFPVTEGSSQ